MSFNIIIIIIIMIIIRENYLKGSGNETIYLQGSPLIINKYIYIKNVKYLIYLNLLSKVEYCIK